MLFTDEPSPALFSLRRDVSNRCRVSYERAVFVQILVGQMHAVARIKLLMPFILIDEIIKFDHMQVGMISRQFDPVEVVDLQIAVVIQASQYGAA